MIDRYVLPLQRRLLAGPAAELARRGVRADQMTLAGFLAGVLACAVTAAGLYAFALVLLAANRLADGLDGAIARQLGPTDRGAFMDIAADFLVYALIPLGFALADPAANALPAAVLITAFVGTGSSFLAFAAVAAKRGLRTPDYPSKGIYYLGGLTEGTETIAVFVAMYLWPGAFSLLAMVFAALCVVTTAMRWLFAWQVLAAASDAE